MERDGERKERLIFVGQRVKKGDELLLRLFNDESPSDSQQEEQKPPSHPSILLLLYAASRRSSSPFFWVVSCFITKRDAAPKLADAAAPT